MGNIIPDMGTISPAGIADALFPAVRRRVLGLLFGATDQDFSTNDLIRLAGSGTGAVHRELTDLAAVGLITVSPVGNQRRYRANRDSPVFWELRGLLVKTTGLVDPVRNALSPYRDRIVAAFIHGPVAKGSDKAGSEIDLVLLGDDLADAEIRHALNAAEKALARPIVSKVVSPADWRRKLAKKKGFAAKVAHQPRLFVIGSEHDLHLLDDESPPQLRPVKPVE